MADGANYSINWNAQVFSTSATLAGCFVVTASGGGAYLAATTANYNAAPVVFGCLLAAPSNVAASGIGTAPILFDGPISSSVSGITNTANGYARLNLTTGRAEWVASYSATDVQLGPCVNATILFGAGNGSLASSVVSLTDEGIIHICPLYGYGAFANDVDDDQPALQSLIDEISTLSSFQASRVTIDLSARPSGEAWVLEGDLVINDDTGSRLAGLTIRGGAGAPTQDYSSCATVKYRRQNKRFAGKTVSCSAVAAVTAVTNDRPYNAFVTISGADVAALGLDDSDVLYREARVDNCSHAVLEGHVKLCARTANSVTFGVIIAGGTIGAIPASLTLDFKLLDSPFRVNARNVFIYSMNIQADTAGVDMFAGITTSHSPNAGDRAVTRCRFKDIQVWRTDGGTADFKHGVHIGAPLLPQVGCSLYLDSTLGFPVPFMPTNQDYMTCENVTKNYGNASSGNGGAIHTHNTTQQSRGNIFRECAAVSRGYAVNIETVMDAGAGLGESSMAFTADNCTGGQVDALFKFNRAQGAATLILYPHVEWASKLVDFGDFGANGAKMQVKILSGYSYSGETPSPGDPGSMQSPYVTVRSTDMEIEGLRFDMNSLPAVPVSLFYGIGYMPTLVLVGCRLPSVADLNGGCHFEIGPLVGSSDTPTGVWTITLKDCHEYDVGTGQTFRLVDETITLRTAAYAPNNKVNARRAVDGNTVGTALSLAGGISTTKTMAGNLLGQVVISDGETRGALLFDRDEVDPLDTFNEPNDLFRVWAVPASYTGAPSTNSAIVVGSGAVKKYAWIDVLAAPGAGTSRTYNLFGARTDAVGSSTWTPARKSTLAVWMISDEGFGVLTRAGNYPHWRNQGPVRGTESVLVRSQADPYLHAGKEPILVAGGSEFNNRDVVSFAGANDCMSWDYCTADFPCAAPPFTIFCVARAGASKAQYQDLFWINAGQIQFRADITNGHITLQVAGTPLTYALDWTLAVHVIAVVVNGATSKIYVDAKTAVASGAVGAYAPAANEVMVLGDYGGLPFPWLGKLGEFLIFREAMSNADIGLELDRLGAAWGKAIGP